MFDIKERGWLIQNNNIRFLADRTGKKHSLTLAIADVVKVTTTKRFRMHRSHGFLYLFLILSGKNTESACIRVASGCHNIMTGHKLRTHSFRKNYCHACGKLFIGKRIQIAIIKVNFSTNDLQLSCDTFQNRRFTRTIWTNEGYNLPFFNSNTDIMN